MTCDEKAECRNTLGSYSCHCLTGYHGNGQECSNVNECLNGKHQCHKNAICIDNIGSYTCKCKQGYKMIGNECIDVNECNEGLGNCHYNADCINLDGSFKCECEKGFTGNGVSICHDVNECLNATLHQCPRNSYCINDIGSHECVCYPGFFKEEDRCHQCLDNGGGYCHKYAECFKAPFENYCRCKSGFKGNGTYCEDFNECKQKLNPCLHGQCRNHIGSYSCLCFNGFRANDANQVCLDIDECQESYDQGVQLCNGTFEVCRNLDGTYSCVSKYNKVFMKLSHYLQKVKFFSTFLYLNVFYFNVFIVLT